MSAANQSTARNSPPGTTSCPASATRGKRRQQPHAKPARRAPGPGTTPPPCNPGPAHPRIGDLGEDGVMAGMGYRLRRQITYLFPPGTTPAERLVGLQIAELARE